MPDPNLRIARATQPYLLKNSFILTDLPVRELDILRKDIKPEDRKRGEVLFREGSFSKGAFLLISGKAKIFQQAPNGQRQTLYIFTDGDLIGYRQIITEEPYPISAVLLENATLGFVPKETFQDLLHSSPVFTRNVLTALAMEFSVWMNRMTAFAQFPVRRRLVLALLVLHEQYRRSGSPPGHITITRTELAEYVGTSLETVVRALNHLKSLGLVEIKGRSIKLPNTVALDEILQEEED